MNQTPKDIEASYMPFKKNKTKSLKDVFTWYSTFTSVQGLTQFYASNTQLAKTYWGILFLAFSIFTYKNVVQVFEDYFQYDVVTGVHFMRNSSIKFPSVTICNANRVHCGNLHQYIENCEIVSFFYCVFFHWSQPKIELNGM